MNFNLLEQASDVSFEASTAVISHVVSATKAVLDAAATASVTRVVLTSSSSAALFSQPGVEGIVVTESESFSFFYCLEYPSVCAKLTTMRYSDSWNDFAVKAAQDESLSADERGFMIYAASKTEGERAAWKWVEENKPMFTLNTVLPNFTVSSEKNIRI